MGMEVRYLNYNACPCLCVLIFKRRFIHDHILPIRFGQDVVDVITTSCLHGYPNHDEYPVSFPIIGTWVNGAEHYDMSRGEFDDKSEEEMEKWEIKRGKASKEAEIIALLIAMAQKQSEALKKERFEDNVYDDRLLTFRVRGNLPYASFRHAYIDITQAHPPYHIRARNQIC